MFFKPTLYFRIGLTYQKNSQVIIILRAITTIGTDFTKIDSAHPYLNMTSFPVCNFCFLFKLDSVGTSLILDPPVLALKEKTENRLKRTLHVM